MICEAVSLNGPRLEGVGGGTRTTVIICALWGCLSCCLLPRCPSTWCCFWNLKPVRLSIRKMEMSRALSWGLQDGGDELSSSVWVLGECHCFRAWEMVLVGCVLMLPRSTVQKDERRGINSPIMINLFLIKCLSSSPFDPTVLPPQLYLLIFA